MAGMYSAITQTTLSAAAGTSDTTLNVTDASGLPDANTTCKAYLVALMDTGGVTPGTPRCDASRSF